MGNFHFLFLQALDVDPATIVWGSSSCSWKRLCEEAPVERDSGQSELNSVLRSNPTPMRVGRLRIGSHSPRLSHPRWYYIEQHSICQNIDSWVKSIYYFFLVNAVSSVGLELMTPRSRGPPTDPATLLPCIPDCFCFKHLVLAWFLIQLGDLYILCLVENPFPDLF